MKKMCFAIVIALIMSEGIRAAAPEKEPKPELPEHSERHPYRGSISVLGGITMAGLQGEYDFIPEFGVRTVGLCILGADFNSMNRNEYIIAAIIAPVIHLAPEFKILDPVLMIGLVYSYHHWESKLSYLNIGIDRTVRRGNLHDVTFGTGMGFNFKFANRFKTGINLWINYDYSVVTTISMRKKKGNRILLPIPLIECTVQF
ncbi:MAG: hypothetical protein KA369_12370 [Spirochaetes bacterium]|nr:hypothetical protein [Spirochaetota bacterium]